MPTETPVKTSEGGASGRAVKSGVEPPHSTSRKIKDCLLTPPLDCAYTHGMSTALDFSARQNCVCFNLRRVTRAVTQAFDAEIRRHGIRSTQGTLLTAIHMVGPTNMADLSDVLGMERTTLLRNLRPLQRDEWVAVESSGPGGRVEISLTAKGRKQIEKLAPAWESAQRAVVDVLGESRWSAILADLDTVAAALKN